MTRVAVVGAGYFGQFHYDAWSRMDDCTLVGLCTRADDEGARETARRYSVPARFTDIAEMVRQTRPDLVDITAPSAVHAEAVRAIAGDVKWIICQKPFCTTIEEARAVTDFAAQQGSRVVIHENIRFQPWYRQIRQLIDLGAAGQIYQVTFRLRPGDGQGDRAYLDRQPYFQQMPRFLIHETGIHWIDTFRYLLGEITSVSADLRQLNPAIAGEDAGIVQFQFASGVRGTFDGNRLSDHAAQNRRLTMGELVLEGSDATITLDGEARIWIRRHGANDAVRHDYSWNDHLFGGDCVYNTNAAALAAFRAGETAETEAASYLKNLDLEEAAYRSNLERRWIDLPQ